MKWEKVKLGEVIDLYDHVRVPLSEMERQTRKGPYPYYGAQSIIDYVNEFLFDGDYILLAEDGENLRTRKQPIAFSVSGQFWVNNHAHILKAKKAKSTDLYIKYYLNNSKIEPYITGAAQPKLSQKNLKAIELDLPPLPTQRKIVSILSAYDDLIEDNLKRIKLLEEKAQLHYKELMQESTRFDKVRLEEFVSVVKGRKPANVLEQPEDDSQLYLLLDTVERTKSLYTSDLTLPLSKESDVLMCMDGARSGWSFRGMVGAIGSTMAIWRSNSERISGELLYQFMKQNESAMTQGNTGAAIPHANRKFILDMKMAMPPKKETKYFESLTLPIVKLINTLHNQNTKLCEARDILLPRLMNGEIEV